MAREKVFALKHNGEYLMLPVPSGWNSKSDREKREHIEMLKRNAKKGTYGRGTSTIDQHKRKFEVIEI